MEAQIQDRITRATSAVSDVERLITKNLDTISIINGILTEFHQELESLKGFVSTPRPELFEVESRISNLTLKLTAFPDEHSRNKLNEMGGILDAISDDVTQIDTELEIFDKFVDKLLEDQKIM